MLPLNPEVPAPLVCPRLALFAPRHRAPGPALKRLLQGRLILIRPDGHIAFRGSAKHPELLKNPREKVFGTSNGAAKESK